MVVREDLYTDRDLQESNYENILTSTQNGITTFKAVKQVQQMLGDIGDDFDDLVNEDNEGRRLSEEDCADDAVCKDPSSRCDCEDKSFYCDCQPNYDFIKVQPLAGCDGLDSDGDGKADNCEDNVAPRLVLKNSYLFLCDKTNPQKLCFGDETFKQYSNAENFLLSQVQVSDDCATQSQLSIDVNRVDSSTCGETTYSKCIRIWQSTVIVIIS